MPRAPVSTPTRGPRRRGSPPVNPPPPEDHPGFDATQGDVLLHVYEELAQHLGQLEVTRDVLLARRA